MNKVQSYEHRDFIYTFPPNSAWAMVGSRYTDTYTIAGAKKEFYDMFQREILSQLQKWLDEGWEPITEVGPAAIEVATKKSWEAKSGMYWAIHALLMFFTFFLSLLLIPFQRDTLAYPTRYVVKMRRAIA